MKRLILSISIVLLIGQSAYGITEKELSKKIDESFDKVQSVYFEAGFTSGALCGVQLSLKYDRIAKEGVEMSEDDVAAELEKCKREAKRKYEVK